MPRAQVNGTELFYVTHGAGRPLLAMHGGLGHDHSYLRPGLDALGEAATVLYYDHRGNGRSERPPSLDAVDHATWVADADALRAHLGHERVVLFGHSYGSFLAIEYALAHPDRLAGLILCSSTPAFDYPDVMMANASRRGTPRQLEALQRGLAGPLSDDAEYEQFWNEIQPLYFHEWAPHQARNFAETRYSAAAFNAAMFRCVPRYDVVRRLNEIAIPTLILSGRHDWIAPPAQGGARLHRGIVGSQLVILEESGHYPFLEEPERFGTAVRAWLSALQ